VYSAASGTELARAPISYNPPDPWRDSSDRAIQFVIIVALLEVGFASTTRFRFASARAASCCRAPEYSFSHERTTKLEPITTHTKKLARLFEDRTRRATSRGV